MPLRYTDLLAQARASVRELMPWDLAAQLAAAEPPLVLDVREPREFAALRIAGALNVPRGVLEQASEWDYDETEPALAGSRARAIVIVCRSGNRSLLAAQTLQQLGFADVISLATGLRGWNDAEQPLVDGDGRALDADTAEALLAPRLRQEQRRPR
ncbi:MAG: rhodanese-like domain-containing protein [Betaproteobacteria bacterium]|nr:rhodanese-like domain-containing protein [Betaproteobacteria bacterium]MCC6248639.1 rhodanese-like domain-containing protein [Rubrivivax sp.]MCL4698645.1 rhodanese-like domain-containing protein [Burkholderiaceae bacterium]